MTLHFPQQRFYTLDRLCNDWQVDMSELRQWLIFGELKAHVWLPIMTVYKVGELIDCNQVKCVEEICHWEGYMPVLRYMHHRLFKYGAIRLRQFCNEGCEYQYRIPLTADDITIEAKDLVVLPREKVRFENLHSIGLAEIENSASDLEIGSLAYAEDPSFRVVRYKGEGHRFGEIQAKVLQLLYTAAQRGEPWQSGKQLLRDAGSSSFNLSNIYKHKPIWKDLVLSDGCGLYRLSSCWNIRSEG